MDISSIKNKIRGYNSYINGWQDMKIASVVIPLVEIDNEVCLLFEVRAKKLRSQPGDICFPGGKVDKGENPRQAALREIKEELNLEDIEIIHELDLFVRYNGMIIHPFLAEVKNIEEIKINEDEVDSIFYVPLKYFLENEPLEINNKLVVKRGEDFPYDLIVNGKNYAFKDGDYKSLFYIYENRVIWGVTAAIIKSLQITISTL